MNLLKSYKKIKNKFYYKSGVNKIIAHVVAKAS